ncbi:hypothetical protein BXY66_2514 [Shimia isoporae]|uniref:Uncharacterized protein n=1 Tax=Shimia isoporae TaxID=647720 RepID=A0A4R1NBY7_9RHOB|nr:hypothetical protein [Shimia isoporae]TCL01203.1 hypothetical protein BXY66_2514 [Shimia isoporae]
MEKIDIKSRRFDASPDETVILSFPEGLKMRPLLCGAEYSERMTSGGTEIRILLDTDDHRSNYYPMSGKRGRGGLGKVNYNSLTEAISTHFPTSDVPVLVRANDKTFLNDGSNWQEEPASTLLQRIEGDMYPGEEGRLYERTLSLVKEEDGTVVGRASFYPDRLSGRILTRKNEVEGVITAKGAKVCIGNFRGILLGSPVRAARDAAVPYASPQALKNWASEQARLIFDQNPSGEDQLDIAAQVASLGGDIGNLKFCEVGGEFLNRSELREFLKGRDDILVAHDAGVYLAGSPEISPRRTESCISVAHGLRTLIPTMHWRPRTRSNFLGIPLHRIANTIVAEEFEIDPSIIQKMTKVEDGKHVYEAFSPAWVRSNGTLIKVSGEFYKRGMTLEDVDEFFVPEEKRE